MKKMTSAEVRQAFIDFFEKMQHKRVTSSSLVPGNDPTLLFVNAGMVPFKDVFLGQDQRPYTRAVSSQKCMRVSGKHNDLENVGPSPRHHTFFEMLGNFSFGDYFKRDAIRFAYDLLTQVYEIPPSRLAVTVYQNDDEAYDLWIQIGIPATRIARMGPKTNFWQMAETGPCGPNSEIHFDLTPEAGEESIHAALIAEDDRLLELWNLVFMQFNRTQPDPEHTGQWDEPLPAPGVDTGLGLERMVSVLQGVEVNYETDLFMPIIERVQQLVGASDVERDANVVPYRVIADHMRAATFLISDGVRPGATGRDYVCRMVIRRAVRFGSKLGFEEPFLADVADAVIDTMRVAYPELDDQRETIRRAITNEEIRFRRTMDRALIELDEEIREQKTIILDKSLGEIKALWEAGELTAPDRRRIREILTPNVSTMSQSVLAPLLIGSTITQALANSFAGLTITPTLVDAFQESLDVSTLAIDSTITQALADSFVGLTITPTLADVIVDLEITSALTDSDTGPAGISVLAETFKGLAGIPALSDPMKGLLDIPALSDTFRKLLDIQISAPIDPAKNILTLKDHSEEILNEHRLTDRSVITGFAEKTSDIVLDSIKRLSNIPRLTRPINELSIFPGDLVFRIHSEKGLPREITRDIAQESIFTIDEEGFREAQQQHEAISRGQTGLGTETIDSGAIYQHTLSTLQQQGTLENGVTQNPYGPLSRETQLLAILRGGELVEQVAVGDKVEVVLDSTPFYVEAGGQVSDTGVIEGDGWTIDVEDARLPVGGLVVHLGEVVEGLPQVGAACTVTVDQERRLDIMRNHTATHLLHAQLRAVLGTHVQQRGSLVEPERLRFDFSHDEAVTADELDTISRRVNAAILANMSVVAHWTDLDTARAEGAMALFGEKYGDDVRTINIWADEDTRYSYELCGGNHVEQTGIIGPFVITSESSVAQGIRRIEARTGRSAAATIHQELKRLNHAAVQLSTTPDALTARVVALQDEFKASQQENTRLRRQVARLEFNDLLQDVYEIGPVMVLVARVNATTSDTLREMTDWFRDRVESGIIVLGMVADNGKPQLIAAATKDLKKRVHAGQIIKAAAQIVGGGGGGRPDMAQAGGKNPEQLEAALQHAADLIQAALGE